MTSVELAGPVTGISLGIINVPNKMIYFLPEYLLYIGYYTSIFQLHDALFVMLFIAI